MYWNRTKLSMSQNHSLSTLRVIGSQKETFSSIPHTTIVFGQRLQSESSHSFLYRSIHFLPTWNTKYGKLSARALSRPHQSSHYKQQLAPWHAQWHKCLKLSRDRHDTRRDIWYNHILSCDCFLDVLVSFAVLDIHSCKVYQISLRVLVVSTSIFTTLLRLPYCYNRAERIRLQRLDNATRARTPEVIKSMLVLKVSVLELILESPVGCV